MTEYLLRLSDEIPDIFFTMLVILFIAMWPRKRMFKWKVYIPKTYLKSFSMNKKRKRR